MDEANRKAGAAMSPTAFPQGLRVTKSARYWLTDGSKAFQSEIIDNQKQFAKNFGVQNGDYVLIRPDGYIGFITSSLKIESLENYLDVVQLPAPA